MVVPDGGAAGGAARGEAPTIVVRTGAGRTAPNQPGPLEPSLAWPPGAWDEARIRVRRAGRAYVWLNLVEQRLRSVVSEVLRPVYEPVHGEDWVLAAAGPAGEEWAQRAGAVREVSRRKGYLLDPDDDSLVVFLTLPQLRELMVQHWPCFEPFLSDRREVELALDELEVARHVVSRNRALSENVLAQAERAAARLLQLLDGEAGAPGLRAPVDVVEELVGDRYADLIGSIRTGSGCCGTCRWRTCWRARGGWTRWASASTCCARTSPGGGWSAWPTRAAGSGCSS